MNQIVVQNSKSFHYKTSNTEKLERNNVEEDDAENCCAIKIFKQFLENTRHTIN